MAGEFYDTGSGLCFMVKSCEVAKMAMLQRDNKIEAIKRLDALLEHAVMHGDEAEVDRIRDALRNLTEEIWGKE